MSQAMEANYINKVDISDKIISICLAEYEIRTNEILKRVELQSSLIRMQTALVSAVIAAIIAVITKIPDYQSVLTYLLLLAPFPFYFLSWSHANHDYMICANARYLTSKTFIDMRNELYKTDMLTWEFLLHRERMWRSKYLPRGLTHGEEYFMSLYVPLLSTIAAYLLIVYRLIFMCADDNKIKMVLDTLTSIYNCKLCESELIVTANLASALCQVIIVLLNALFISYTIRTRDTVRKAYDRIVEPMHEEDQVKRTRFN